MASLKVQLSGVTHEFPYNSGESLLDCALRNNLDAPYSCLEGVCTSCMAVVTEGQVDFPEDGILSPKELQSGKVLTCQTRIKEGCAMVGIDYDAL